MQWSQCSYIGEMSVSAVFRVQPEHSRTGCQTQFWLDAQTPLVQKRRKNKLLKFFPLGCVPHFPVLCSLIGSCRSRIYSVTNQTNVAKTLQCCLLTNHVDKSRVTMDHIYILDVFIVDLWFQHMFCNDKDLNMFPFFPPLPSFTLLPCPPHCPPLPSLLKPSSHMPPDFSSFSLQRCCIAGAHGGISGQNSSRCLPERVNCEHSVSVWPARVEAIQLVKHRGASHNENVEMLLMWFAASPYLKWFCVRHRTCSSF